MRAFAGSHVPGRVGPQFGMERSKPKPLSPEVITWYWNPNRAGMRFAPKHFRDRLKQFDPELECVWNGHTERWQIFMRDLKIQTKICAGWKLLFPVQDADHNFMPLDERVFCRLFEASAQRWGSGKQYWGRIEAEMERDKEKAEKDRKEDVKSTAGDYFNHLQPSVSMFGPSNGSKCSNL